MSLKRIVGAGLFLIWLVSGCALDALSLETPSSPLAVDAGSADAAIAPGSLDAGTIALPVDAGPPPAGRRAYLVAADELSFSILDLADPARPTVLSGDGDGSGADDEPLPLYALASDERGQVFAARHGGVEIYTLADGRLSYAGRLGLDAGQPSALAAGRGRLYVALGAAGLLIVDVRDAREPAIIGHVAAERSIHDVALTERGHLAVYDGVDPGLRIYDVTDAATPTALSADITDFVGSRSGGIASARDFVALDAVYGVDGSGLWFWRLDASGTLASLGFHPTARAPRGRAVVLWPLGPHVVGYFADQHGGVVIAEARSDRAQPRSGALAVTAYDVARVDHHLYVARGDEGVGVYGLDEAHPEAPLTLGSVAIRGAAIRLTVLAVDAP